MKINRVSAISYLADKDFLSHCAAIESFLFLIAQQNEGKENDPENDPKVIAEILKTENLPICNIDFIEDLNGYKNLVLSEKTYKNLSNYKVPTSIRYEVLRTLPNRKYNIQLTNTLGFKYLKTDTHIYVMIYDKNGTEHRDIFLFYIDLVNDTFFTSPRRHPETNMLYCLNETDLIKNYYDKVIVTLTYLELTDVTFDICYANSKRGHILKGNDIKNELPFNVIQVNTNWNTTKLHIGDSFQVKGHWRLQPYGENRARYKYIFIDTYDKTGIIKRRAGKETITIS
jgi:hypothetical protein